MTKNKNTKQTERVIDLMTQGYDNEYLKTFLLETCKPEITEEEAEQLITEAEGILEQEYSKDRQEIWNLHRVRYTTEINRLLATEELPESEIGKTITYTQWEQSRKKKVRAYFKAMATMGQLETLMQLTSESTLSIDVNEEINVNMQETNNPEYNLDALTWEEQLEFYDLLMAAKVVDDEPTSVIQAIPDTPILHHKSSVSIGDRQVNVDQIKHKTEPTVFKLVDSVSNPISKLRTSLAKIAAQTLKDKGANLDRYEERLLDNNVQPNE